MFFIHVTQLFQQTRQFAARFGKVVFDALHLARKLGALDQFVIEQFAQSFGEDLGGDAGNKSLQRPGRVTPRPMAARTAADHLQPTTSSSRR